MKALSIVIFLMMVVSTSVQSQPLQREWLWQRLMTTMDISSMSEVERSRVLKELLRYDSLMQFTSFVNDSTHALLKQRIGAIYFHGDDLSNAQAYMKQAVTITTAGANKNTSIKHNIRNYYNLAWMYDVTGDIPERIKSLDSCAGLSIRLGITDYYVVLSLTSLYEYWYGIGDYKRSINYADLGEKYARIFAAGSHSQSDSTWGIKFALLAHFWKVNALLRLKDYAIAEKLVAEKVAECKSDILPRPYLATLYQQFAEISLSRKNYKEAHEYLKKALEFDIRARDSAGCRVILNNIGYKIYLLNYKDYKTALKYCRRALDYERKGPNSDDADRIETLNVYNFIAAIYTHSRQYDSAFYYYQYALDQIKPGISEKELLQKPMKEFIRQPRIHYVTGLLLDKADAYVQHYRDTKREESLNQAISTYKSIDQLLTKIKSSQAELESKLSWRLDSRRLYENAIAACYLKKDPVEAIYFFEKSRSVLLQDQLLQQQWMSANDIKSLGKIIRSLQAINNELDTLSQSNPRFNDVQVRLLKTQNDMSRLQDLIKANSPYYYQSYLDTTAITLDDIRKKILSDHDALVEIFNGDSSTYLLYLTRQHTKLVAISKVDYDSLSKRINSFVTNAELLNSNFQEFRSVSYNLFKLLFSDIPLSPGRMVISPAGENFPFEALVMNASGPPVYFVSEQAVSYTYSARYLMTDFQNRHTARNQFMGVAPINYASGLGLSSLPGSDASIERLAGYFADSRKFVGSKASKSNFLGQYYNYRIIQLYTHANDAGGRDEPVIYFADSSLYLSELINESKPQTSLIVLSACETGKGKLHLGEGIFSFNRAFAALGIPAAVTNLWKVDSKATYELTELFYQYISDGLPTDVALQKAKLDLINKNEKVLPYYWAASILTGKTETIELKKSMRWTLAIGVLVAIALIVYVSWKWYKSQKSPAGQA